MLRQIQDRIFSALIENKSLKAFLAFAGALLVAAGFQGYSIGFIPSGVIVAGGILTEVFLVYIVSIGIEKAREDIIEHRKEIDRMLRDVREISRDIDRANREVRDVQQEVSQAKKEISRSQRKIEDASTTAEKAKKEIESMKRSIERASRRY